MIKAIKTKIYPTKTQKDYFNRCFGIRRFAWNWGLENWGTYKSWTKLDKAWNHSEMKNTKPYLYEVNSMIKTMAFKELSRSWKKLYKDSKNNGEPKFKTKKKDTNRFSMFNKSYNTIIINGKWIDLNTTRKFGRIKFKAAENLEFLNECRVAEWTISEKCGNYYISIIYERINHIQENINQPQDKIGIDAGMKTMITSWNGKDFSEINLPNKILYLENQIDYFNKKLSRKKYNSIRYKELSLKIKKIYVKILNIKKDFINKLTNYLVKTYKIINFESYDFEGALRFTKGSRKLYRLSPYMLQEKIIEKCNEYGSTFNLIKNKPTTQTCSSCGNRYVKEEKLTLSDRIFKCNHCDLEIGRDKNSAINIYNL